MPATTAATNGHAAETVVAAREAAGMAAAAAEMGVNAN
jgi:hypothetical protein